MDVITINVSGTMFVSTKEILSRSPYFKNMFDDCDHSDTITLSRSPHIFKHILALLIDDTYPYPIKYQNELKYFLIDYTPIDTINEKFTSIIKRMDDIDKQFKLLNENHDKQSTTIVNLINNVKKLNNNDPITLCIYPECMNEPYGSDKMCQDHQYMCPYEIYGSVCGRSTSCDYGQTYCDWHR